MKTIGHALIPLVALIMVACQGEITMDPTTLPIASEAPTSTEVEPTLQEPVTDPVGTQAAAEPTPVQNTPGDLELELSDADWNGEAVPEGQQCLREGGVEPSTPEIRVSNLPQGADTILLEFSDRDFRPMDNGGHGKIGFLVSGGVTNVLIPSVPGHSFELPKGFFVVHEHLASSFDRAGAYMPPCSGAVGHAYYVTVRAAQLLSMDRLEFLVLDQGTLDLGEY
jgi:hypothetical protein